MAYNRSIHHLVVTMAAGTSSSQGGNNSGAIISGRGRSGVGGGVKGNKRGNAQSSKAIPSNGAAGGTGINAFDVLGSLTSSDSSTSFGMVGTTLPPAIVLKLCDTMHNLTALDLTSSYIGF